uniref:Uncharacterized protein n=1 Tax=Picea sitchensis TaxID=3332 RepID=A0A6B9XUA8_PICSI|nr:hypothetical protein Q903MT_gene3857 [Picea sitchensis]
MNHKDGIEVNKVGHGFLYRVFPFRTGNNHSSNLIWGGPGLTYRLLDHMASFCDSERMARR